MKVHYDSDQRIFLIAPGDAFGPECASSCSAWLEQAWAAGCEAVIVDLSDAPGAPAALLDFVEETCRQAAQRGVNFQILSAGADAKERLAERGMSGLVASGASPSSATEPAPGAETMPVADLVAQAGLCKLAVAGSFVSGLTHVLNNRLVPILGYAQLFRTKFGDDPKTNRQMESIETSAGEVRNIFSLLVRIVRSRTPDFRPGDLNRALRSAFELCKPDLKDKGIDLALRLDDSLPLAPFDPEMMLQVFLAILYRAPRAFPARMPAKRLSIETKAEGEEAVIRFCDNGPLLSEVEIVSALDSQQPMQRIGYEDFFNLSVPESIVTKHHGRLTIRNLEGGGREVAIALPVKFPTQRPWLKTGQTVGEEHPA